MKRVLTGNFFRVNIVVSTQETIGGEEMLEKLKALRHEKGTTCEQLSDLLGFKTRGAYHKKESGNVPFTLKEAKVLADYFGKDINDIFFVHEVSCEGTQTISES